MRSRSEYVLRWALFYALWYTAWACFTLAFVAWDQGW